MLADLLNKIREWVDYEFKFGEYFVATIAQLEDELDELLELLRSLLPTEPRVVLECGFYRGGSSLIWRALFPNAYLIAVDLFDPTAQFDMHAHKAYQTLMRLGNFTYLCASTNNPATLYLLRRLLGVIGAQHIDFVFLDAEKDYPTYIMLFEPLFSNDTLIVCHDIFYMNGYYDLIYNPLSPHIHRDGVDVQLLGNKCGYIIFRNIAPAAFYQFPYKVDRMMRPLRVFSNDAKVRAEFGIPDGLYAYAEFTTQDILGDDFARWDVSVKFAGFAGRASPEALYFMRYSYNTPDAHTTGAQWFVVTDGEDYLNAVDWMWLFAHILSARCRGVITLTSGDWDVYYKRVGGRVCVAPIKYLPLDGLPSEKVLRAFVPSNADDYIVSLLGGVCSIEVHGDPQYIVVGAHGKQVVVAVDSLDGDIAIATSIDNFLRLGARIPTFLATRNLFNLDELEWFPPPIVRAGLRGVLVSDVDVSLNLSVRATHATAPSIGDLSGIAWGVVLCEHSGDCDAAARLSRFGIPYLTDNEFVGMLYPLAHYMPRALLLDYASKLLSDTDMLRAFITNAFAPDRSFYALTPIRFARFLAPFGLF